MLYEIIRNSLHFKNSASRNPVSLGLDPGTTRGPAHGRTCGPEEWAAKKQFIATAGVIADEPVYFCRMTGLLKRQ
jgi:hypothetical protein